MAHLRYGLAVHFKIYPITFALALLFYIDHEYADEVEPSLRRLVRMVFTKKKILFGVTSLAVALALTLGFYFV